MASTKGTTAIWGSQTLTAGDPDTVSSGIDLADGYGGAVYIKLTNGATGPTVPAQVQIECSPDGTGAGEEWYDMGGPFKGQTDTNGVYSWVVEVPIGIKYIRLSAGSNVTENVTVDADLVEMTAI